ncbi:epigen isoform X2 [Amia ocellicauda]|uniref:epigen isoform X2 n=1 Tax=Amia ocellicauda TaxID=2972642 RepID=UPI003464B646
MTARRERHLLQNVFTVIVAAVCSFSTTVTERSSKTIDQLPEMSLTNETGDGSTQLPHMLELLSPCTGDNQSYCMNGHCSYRTDVNKPTCRCFKNYTGERCQHLLLDSHSEENSEKLIAIGIGVFLLFCAITVTLYCCIKKRCKKEKSPYQICIQENTV